MKRIAEEVNEEHLHGENRLIVEDISSREEDWKSVNDCSLGHLQLAEKLIVVIRSLEKDASVYVFDHYISYCKENAGRLINRKKNTVIELFYSNLSR